MVQSINTSSQVNAYEATNDVKTAIAVKMFAENAKTQQIAGSIIQDTAEISEQAMALCKAEQCGQ